MFLILGNKKSDATKIEILLMNNAKNDLLDVFVNKYLSETLPEGLQCFKELEAELPKKLMTMQMPEKKPHPSASVQYAIKNRQKRYLTSFPLKINLNALENYVHNKLIKHNPSLLPYAREIQFDLLLFLWYKKLMGMSAVRSNGPNLDGRLTNRNEFRRNFYSFLLFIRDSLAKDNPLYPPEVKQIKKYVDDAIRRLGIVKKRTNGFK